MGNLRRGEAVGDFSLELNEDQLQVLDWVHDFAENVVRPAAHEWDELEETPWPIIEEAARAAPRRQNRLICPWWTPARAGDGALAESALGVIV